MYTEWLNRKRAAEAKRVKPRPISEYLGNPTIKNNDVKKESIEEYLSKGGMIKKIEAKKIKSNEMNPRFRFCKGRGRG